MPDTEASAEIPESLDKIINEATALQSRTKRAKLDLAWDVKEQKSAAVNLADCSPAEATALVNSSLQSDVTLRIGGRLWHGHSELSQRAATSLKTCLMAWTSLRSG